MDPNRDETTADLIARKPYRLNILIGRCIDWNGSRYDSERPAFAGNVVNLRYGWTALDMPDEARPVSISVPGSSKMDRDAINNANQPGAFVVVPDIAGIEQAVKRLQAMWGTMHVQDNSGHCSHLHQGMFQG